MSQTPEQQAQVEQWRKDFEALTANRLWRKPDGTYEGVETVRWQGYLAGREARQREGEARMRELEKDAARYKWLLINAEVVFDSQQSWEVEDGKTIFSRRPCNFELSKAIDAAIVQEKGG